MDLKADTPEAVVRRVTNAVNEHRWEAVADAAHEFSLVQFRLWELFIIHAMTDVPLDATAEPVHEEHSGPEKLLLRRGLQPADEEVARRELLQFVEAIRAQQSLRPATLLRDLEGGSLHHHDGLIPWQSAPSAESPVLNRRVLGVVPEIRVGGNVAHVVYRQHDDPAGGETVAVTTVRETPEGWRFDATDTGLLLPAARPELPILR